MRHVIDHSLPTVFDSIFDRGVPQEAASEVISLRRLLASARFFAGDDVQFTTVAASSTTAKAGELIAYRIGQDCPTQLVADAVARGAAGILSEQVLPCPLPQCIVGDIERALADITARQLAHPDRRLLTIGIIGSAGKTTTALLIASLFRGNGIRTAYQTDLGDSDGIVQSTSTQSVPSNSDLVQWLGEACDSGCKAAIVELSDEDARHGQYDAIQFDLLVVTGATTCSVDYGQSGLQCVLERLTTTGVVVTPADDAKAIRVVRDSGARIVTYGIRQSADVTAKIIEQSAGMTTLIVSHAETTAVMESSLCGAAMAANHAAATVVGLLIGKPLHEIVETLGQLQVVPGRGQCLSQFGHASLILDAGGSPERAAASLRTYRSMKSGGRLWCVMAIDCGDMPERLARYGNLIERFADRCIVTANRNSKASFLAASHCVLDGVEKCAAIRIVSDHERAVRWAVSEAAPNDTILIIGVLVGQSAYEQRTEIQQIEKWVESERQLNDERRSNKPCDKAVPALKIAQF